MSESLKKVSIRFPAEVIPRLDELRTLFEFDGSRNLFLIYLITEGIRVHEKFMDDEESREYVKDLAKEITRYIAEHEEEVQLKRESALEKGRQKRSKKRGLSVKERVAIRKQIVKFLKKNSKQPVSKRDIYNSVSFSRKKVEKTLKYYNNQKWIIYEPQKNGRAHKVALIGTPAEKEVRRLIRKEE